MSNQSIFISSTSLENLSPMTLYSKKKWFLHVSLPISSRMTSIIRKLQKNEKIQDIQKVNFKICIKIHKCQWIKQTENWCTWRISDKLIWHRNLKKTSDAPGKRSEKVRANKGNGKTESVSKSSLNVNNIFSLKNISLGEQWTFLTTF